MKNPPANRNRHKHCLTFLLLAAALVIPGACIDPATVYHSYRPIPSKGWAAKDTLLFNVHLTDMSSFHYLYVQVRNRNDYPYRNLSLVIRHNLRDSATQVTDTIKCMLADENGRWTGNGRGALFQTAHDAGGFKATAPGMRTVKIVHEMKDEPLKGINDIGIRIEH